MWKQALPNSNSFRTYVGPQVSNKSPIPSKMFWIFQYINRKALLENFRMIFSKANFSNFSKVNQKTDFIRQLYVILALIWCIVHFFQANIWWDMNILNYFWKHFIRSFWKDLENDDRNKAFVWKLKPNISSEQTWAWQGTLSHLQNILSKISLFLVIV